MGYSDMAENLDLVELAMRKFGRWPEKTIPYRMKYLEYFVRNRSEAEMRERAAKEFLQHVEDLGTSGRFEDWQLRQAEETLRWYCREHLGIERFERVLGAKAESFESWQEAIESTRKRIRTMIYTHVLRRGAADDRSPLDDLEDLG